MALALLTVSLCCLGLLSRVAYRYNLGEDLCDAAYDGNLSETQRLVQSGADLNHRGIGWGLAPLELALYGKHEAIIRWLLAHGASDDDSLYYAIGDRRPDVVRALLRNGADPYYNPGGDGSPVDQDEYETGGAVFWAAGFKIDPKRVDWPIIASDRYEAALSRGTPPGAALRSKNARWEPQCRHPR